MSDWLRYLRGRALFAFFFFPFLSAEGDFPLVCAFECFSDFPGASRGLDKL